MSSGEKPKTTASGLLGKTKTEFARLKQQAMVKLGKAEATVDIPHEQEIQRFNHTYDLLRKIDRDTIRMLELMKELAIIQNTLADDFYELYDSSSEVYNGIMKYQEVSKQFDQARTELETQIKEDFQEPLSKYLGQFRTIQERLKEEEIRKIDMDRYARELKSYQEKAKTQKASVYETKYETAKSNYQNLHSELERDMPALFNDRTKFFNPAFATMVTGVAEYYKTCTKAANEAVSVVGNINRKQIHNHSWVVTSVESSAASHKSSVSPSSSANTPSSPKSGPSSSHDVPPAKSLPQPGPRPSQQANNHPHAKAMFDFVPSEANELGFRVGDVITILQMKGEWWEGELNGKRGLLPSNYVKLMQ